LKVLPLKNSVNWYDKIPKLLKSLRTTSCSFKTTVNVPMKKIRIQKY